MKNLNRFERLSRKPLPFDSSATYDVPEEVFQFEQVEVDGRMLKRMVKKTVKPSSRVEKFKCSDFATENLIAIGAKDHFKPISPLKSNDIDLSLASAESILDLLDSRDRAASLVAAGSSDASVGSAGSVAVSDGSDV